MFYQVSEGAEDSGREIRRGQMTPKFYHVRKGFNGDNDLQVPMPVTLLLTSFMHIAYGGTAS